MKKPIFAFKYKFKELDANFQMKYMMIFLACGVLAVGGVIWAIVAKNIKLGAVVLIPILIYAIYEARYVYLAMTDSLAVIECVCISTELKKIGISLTKEPTMKRQSEFDCNGQKIIMNTGASLDIKEGSTVKIFAENSSIVQQEDGVFMIVNPVYVYKIKTLT